MTTTRASVMAFSAMLALSGSSDLLAQVGSSSRPVSTTVLATYVMRSGELALLVLWRGKAGWFWQSGGERMSLGGTSETQYQLISAGGLTLRVDYDFESGVARVADHPVSLDDVNVILVDNVDDPAGPTIVQTYRTPPVAGEQSHPETVVIQRHIELRQFLQCDTPLPPSASPSPLLDPRVAFPLCYDRPR
jgi:hypothetical protein